MRFLIKNIDARLNECLRLRNIQTVATSALATGYGHLPFDEYLRIASTVLADPACAAFKSVTLCVANDYSCRQAIKLIEEESLRIQPA